MKELVFVIVGVGALYLFIKRVRKMRDTADSKISINEHPSTFKKPDIEMTLHNQEDESESNRSVLKNCDDDHGG